MASPVTVQLRDDIKAHLEKIVEALQSHPLFDQKHPCIYFVWDFVKRAEYMLSEYDNILDARPLQHPHQFRPPQQGTGKKAALKVFQEVCGRTIMLRMIVTDPHMNGAPGNPGPPIDYGDDVKRAVKELEKVVPKEHLMAGMMG